MRSDGELKKLNLPFLLEGLIKYSASDLHLKVGRPPIYRVNGILLTAKLRAFDERQLEAVLYEFLSTQQIKELKIKKDIDFSFSTPTLPGRFRCNLYHQKGSLAAAIRMIPSVIPRLDGLGLPSIIKELCYRTSGLVLVTGPTGSGKSTTLAAMIEYINELRPVNILTVEDPIEFSYKDLKASIVQREVGSDTLSMKDAIVAGMRQDPDIIVIGEVRDKETIQAALTAAETGHLVITTLHTESSSSSMNRILDVFPADMRDQIRVQLASNLIAVFSQDLLERADKKGMIVSCEVMIKSPLIESYLRNNELGKIQDAIADSSGYYRMQSKDQALERLIGAGLVTLEEALRFSRHPEDLKLRLSGVKIEKN